MRRTTMRRRRCIAPLPDPLVLKNGQRVKSAKAWWEQRRPQIVEDFDREVYGRVPANVPGVKWEVVSTTQEKVGSFPVITKQLLGHVDNGAYPLITVDIELSVTTPAQASGPVPVILEFGFKPRPGAPPLPPQPGPKAPDWREQVLAKGWGYAILISHDGSGGQRRGPHAGIIGLTNKGQPRKLDDWGALRAWAWARAARSTTSRPTSRWMRRASRSKGFPATARQRSSPWRMSRASPSASSARPARAARSCIDGISASASRTWRRLPNITGWPATISSTPARSPRRIFRSMRTS